MTRLTRSSHLDPRFRDAARALAQTLGYTAERVELGDERPMGEPVEGDGLLFGWEWTTPEGEALSPALEQETDAGLPGVNWALYRSLGDRLREYGLGPYERGSRSFVDTVRHNATAAQREELIPIALAVCLCDSAKYLVLPEGDNWIRSHQVAWLRGWRMSAHQWLVQTGRWATGPIVLPGGETVLPDQPLVDHYLAHHP